MATNDQPTPVLEEFAPEGEASPQTTLAEALRPDLDRTAKVKLLLAVADETMVGAFGAHDEDKPELVLDALNIAALADSHNLADIADSLRRIADASTYGKDGRLDPQRYGYGPNTTLHGSGHLDAAHDPLVQITNVSVPNEPDPDAIDAALYREEAGCDAVCTTSSCGCTSD